MVYFRFMGHPRQRLWASGKDSRPCRTRCASPPNTPWGGMPTSRRQPMAICLRGLKSKGRRGDEGIASCAIVIIGSLSINLRATAHGGLLWIIRRRGLGVSTGMRASSSMSLSMRRGCMTAGLFCGRSWTTRAAWRCCRWTARAAPIVCGNSAIPSGSICWRCRPASWNAAKTRGSAPFARCPKKRALRRAGS